MPFFPQQLTESAQIVTTAIDKLIPQRQGHESRLFDAMRHATLTGGKRLRPFLVLSSAAIFGGDEQFALRVATAVELIHCYSLVHDDLPAMDNSDMRRGQPSVHKQYDDATAILAGDALQALAFDVLADPDTHPEASVRCELIARLAEAAGPNGMVGGQMLDLIAETTTFDVGTVTRLQRLKTGKLIMFCAESGAIISRVGPKSRLALSNYGQAMGLAFQITDDLLDADPNLASNDIGKPRGQDKKAGKATFVSLLGVDKAREQARMLANQAIASLELFDRKADPLRSVAEYVLDRAGININGKK